LATGQSLAPISTSWTVSKQTQHLPLLDHPLLRGWVTVKKSIRSAWLTVVIGELTALAAFVLAKMIG
jgi:hypothetical protein